MMFNTTVEIMSIHKSLNMFEGRLLVVTLKRRRVKERLRLSYITFPLSFQGEGDTGGEVDN